MKVLSRQIIVRLFRFLVQVVGGEGGILEFLVLVFALEVLGRRP